MKSVSVRSSQRVHRRILQLVQAGHRYLSDGFFADNDIVYRSSDLHSAPIACGGDMPVGKRSAEDSSDVWIGYQCESQYDVC